MTQNRRIFLNIIATYGRSLYAMLIGLFCGRWTLMSLGTVDYGLMGLVGGLTAFITFFNSVMSGAIGRFYAVSVHDVDQCNKWFTTAVVWSTVIPLILIVCGYPAGLWAIRNYLVIPDDRVNACTVVWLCVCISCFVGMVNVPFRAMYGAKQFIAELTIYSFVATTLNALFLYYMITHPGFWMVRLGVWSCLLSVIPQVIICLRAVLCFKECRIRRKYLLRWDALREMLSFSLWNMIGICGHLLKTQGIAVLVNRFFGAAANAAVSLGTSLSGHTSSLSGSMMGAFSPAIMNAYGAGDIHRARELAYLLCKVGVLLMLIFALPLGLEVDEVLRLWLKNPPDLAARFCLLVMISAVIDKTASGHQIMVSACGRIMKYQLFLGSSLVMTLPLAWIFLSLGGSFYMVGVAVIVTMACCAWGRVWFARELVGLSALRWLREVLVPLVVTIFISICVGLLPRLIMGPSFGRVCLTSVFALSALGSCSWFCLLKPHERIYLWGRIRRK